MRVWYAFMLSFMLSIAFFVMNMPTYLHAAGLDPVLYPLMTLLLPRCICPTLHTLHLFNACCDSSSSVWLLEVGSKAYLYLILVGTWRGMDHPSNSHERCGRPQRRASKEISRPAVIVVDVDLGSVRTLMDSSLELLCTARR